MKIKRGCICVGAIVYIFTAFTGASDFQPVQGKHQF